MRLVLTSLEWFFWICATLSGLATVVCALFAEIIEPNKNAAPEIDQRDRRDEIVKGYNRFYELMQTHGFAHLPLAFAEFVLFAAEEFPQQIVRIFSLPHRELFSFSRRRHQGELIRFSVAFAGWFASAHWALAASLSAFALEISGNWFFITLVALTVGSFICHRFVVPKAKNRPPYLSVILWVPGFLTLVYCTLKMPKPLNSSLIGMPLFIANIDHQQLLRKRRYCQIALGAAISFAASCLLLAIGVQYGAPVEMATHFGVYLVNWLCDRTRIQ